MSDVPKIEGPLDPRRIPSDRPGTGKSNAPEFKKVMEVGETDDTQKRNKRQRPQAEEEEEPLEPPSKKARTPSTPFSDYLKEPTDDDSIFATKSGKGPRLVSDTPEEHEAPSHVFAKEKEVEKKKKASLKGEKEETPSPKKKKVVEKETTFIVEPTKKKKKPLPPEPAEQEVLQEEAPEIPNLPAKSIEKSLIPPAPAEELDVSLSLQKKELIREAEQKEREKEEQEKREKAFTPLPDQVQHAAEGAPPPLASTPPAYATLSSQVYDLFEKLTGLLMVQQYKGISTTTVELHMPNSPFNGAKIVLEQYKTAPGSFNLHLIGSPEAVDLFLVHLSDLSAAFASSNLPFKVNILRPSLETKKRIVKAKQDVNKDPDSSHTG